MLAARAVAPMMPAIDSRRRFLQFGLSGATLFAPVPYASVWAQSAQGPRLQRLSKIALIIGNSKYKGAPLKNPGNDAKAIGAALTTVGFETTVRLDAGKAELDASIDAYVNTLTARKCVGLFYYAGHGVQVAWKNYLLGIDVSIDSLETVVRGSLELNALMAGLTRAGNPMNIIMLDACRDNPFGSGKQPDQKGLSQMDAPLNTILAYATAPGNTASDGEGSNGLYTESLLREMQVKEAKVEDIFKRVRLHVRRQSKGAQIPWESTSLEDDFYFLPPASLVAAREEERAKLFAAELKLWESIKEARSAAPFEDYLKRYPSGDFSELAQLQLDRLLAAEGEKRVYIAKAANNPYSAGTARADIAFKVGDTFAYRVFDLDNGTAKKPMAHTVTAITDTEVIYNGGELGTDLMGNTTKWPDGRKTTGNQILPLEFVVNKRWETQYLVVPADGGTSRVQIQLHIVSKEKVNVPAGSFDCFKLEARGKIFGQTAQGFSFNGTVMLNLWLAPDVCRRAIRYEYVRVVFNNRGRFVLDNDRFELESFKQS